MSAAEAHIAEVARALADRHPGVVGLCQLVAAWIASTGQQGRVVWTAGNGGSAANATHLAAHLRTVGIIVVCLSESGPGLSAEANDFGYAHSFTGQAGGLKPGDTIVMFSCSGTSANIQNLADLGMKAGANGGLLSGMPENRPKAIVNATITVPSDDYGAIEDLHSVLLHAIVKEAGALLTGS